MMQLFARNARLILLLATVMMTFTLAMPHSACAADGSGTERCTNFKDLRDKVDDGKPGILTNIDYA